jgi:hypothetical protein
VLWRLFSATSLAVLDVGHDVRSISLCLRATARALPRAARLASVDLNSPVKRLRGDMAFAQIICSKPDGFGMGCNRLHAGPASQPAK